MEEKILVSSKRCSAWRIIVPIILVGVLLLAYSYCEWGIHNFVHFSDQYKAHAGLEHISGCWNGHDYSNCVKNNYSSAFECGFDYFLSCIRPDSMFDNWHFTDWQWGRIAFVVSILVAIIVYWGLKKYELTVTNKRVYGKVIFGKRVDIPLDSVSTVATTAFWKGVTVASSSGRINFVLIKNRLEIYDVINNLLIERQKHSEIIEPKEPVARNGNVEELKQYKELLDSGVITQEEFDAKKKQLLNL